MRGGLSAVPLFEYDDSVRAEGYETLAGVDEAGRGPLCGPVSAAAVILPEGLYIPGLNDSKKLSESVREKLYRTITNTALAWAVSFVGNNMIDEINILEATKMAMKNAVASLGVAPDFILCDAGGISGFGCRSIVRGDAKSASIAAASIIAKVSRDRLMYRMDAAWPGYMFANNKGYPTARHIAAIGRLGLCPMHRKTFCGRFEKPDGKT